MSQSHGSHRDITQDNLANNLDQHYGAFVSANQDQMLRYAQSLGASEFDAQDGVQEAFIQVYKHLRKLIPPEIRAMRLEAYLKTTVHHCVMDQYRKHGRGHLGRKDDIVTSFMPTEHGILYDQIDEQTIGFDEVCITNELREELLVLLEGLPEKHRWIIQARFFGGMSLAELADMVGTTPEGISRILKHCYEKLRALPQAHQLKKTK